MRLLQAAWLCQKVGMSGSRHTFACIQTKLYRFPKSVSSMLQDLIDDVPLYVNAKEVVDLKSGKPLALELNYMTFYAHNGPYWVAGCQVTAQVSSILLIILQFRYKIIRIW